MSFSENLQNLRNAKKMTQEELAEKLDVSRQAVSKWESGTGYPEMDKILIICDIFDCDMNTLMKGKISLDSTSERKKYEAMYNRFSKGIALGVGIILLGVTILVALYGSVDSMDVNVDYGDDILGPIIMLFSAVLSVPIFVYLGVEWSNFQKRNPKISNIYSDEEVDDYNKKYALKLSACIVLIILGVILLLVTEMPAVLLAACTIAVPIIVHSTMQKGKYDIEEYNAESEPTKETELIGRVCGAIMLGAAFIFLGLGFIWDLWSVAWVVFPLGGVLCGIASVLLEKEEK